MKLFESYYLYINIPNVTNILLLIVLFNISVKNVVTFTAKTNKIVWI